MGEGVWDIQPTSHMCKLYFAHMAFEDLQWGGGSHILQEVWDI